MNKITLKTPGKTTSSKAGRSGDKLARMALEGRIGMRGQRTVYGNWRRTPSEQQRINNRAMRNAG